MTTSINEQICVLTKINEAQVLIPICSLSLLLSSLLPRRKKPAVCLRNFPESSPAAELLAKLGHIALAGSMLLPVHHKSELERSGKAPKVIPHQRTPNPSSRLRRHCPVCGSNGTHAPPGPVWASRTTQRSPAADSCSRAVRPARPAPAGTWEGHV